ncbi:MAG: hypothetical protein KGL39_59315 [Patescibacteria group bacterium]|nr:hypothetical protein [Patescibacteria group bacterium]
MKPTPELARELVAHLEAAVDIAYAAGRKAGMEEAEALARSMFNRAADGDEIADAIRAALQGAKDD